MEDNGYALAYSDFWNWFLENSDEFEKIIRDREDIEKNFFDILADRLLSIKEGLCFLVGVLEDGTIDLIFTSEGSASKVVFLEDLVAAAPQIEGWKFTANKPSAKKEGFEIKMGEYLFGEKNISFYVNEYAEYPDLIDLVFVHNELNDDNSEQIGIGVCVFLDNYLGELSFLNNIDNLRVVGADDAHGELIPVSKLHDYLIWRQKEFIEKYDGSWYDDSSGNFSLLQSKTDEGYTILYTINVELLKWDSKASHPWVAVLSINYDGSMNNGLPNKEISESLEMIEAELIDNLKAREGNINIGRQTGLGVRSILFACKDFRKPSVEFDKIQRRYSKQFEFVIDIYKDKYWQSFESFDRY